VKGQTGEFFKAGLATEAIGACRYCRAGCRICNGNRPTQRKTAPAELVDQRELQPMRLAQVRAGIRRRAVWECCV